MREEIITFETAKLAKEKGFNIPSLDYATTQSLLQKWLREEHNINIIPPLYYSGKGYLCSVVSTPKIKFYKTYESALENKLQEALKLI